MELPADYVIFKFYQYCKNVHFNKSANTYQGGCAVCHEGDSTGKKKRCYYLVSENIIYCHNCGISCKPLNWIKQVTGDTYAEITAEAGEFDLVPFETKNTKDNEVKIKVPSLPYDSINLFDSIQITHYTNNLIVSKALETIKNRRLNTAVNRPKTLWLSLKDSTHKNRLVIPFYNESGSIIFYQSRTILDTGGYLPKYLSKKNSDKSLFGMDTIDPTQDHIFIFEGPINAFFVKNSTAVCGIQEKGEQSLTAYQQSQLNAYKFLKPVWVLDSQWIDNTSYLKTHQLIKAGESVFIWPEKIGKRFKDFNDICMFTKKDEISKNFILENTFSGLMAKLKISNISR